LFYLLPLLTLCVCESVLTPFGFRPKECVLEVPSGSVVTEGTDNKLIIKTTLASGEDAISYYQAPSHCGDDMAALKTKRSRSYRSNVNATNGWLDNAYWEGPIFEKFTATYVVPPDPLNVVGSQTLFYFIGLVNINGGAAENILQPVLTWGNGYREWYVKSWACCPMNISVSSPPIYGLKTNSELQGVVTRDSASTWTIDSIFNGQHTTLHSQVGDYAYNYADVTLEVYGVNTCDDLAHGTAKFTDLVLPQVDNNNVLAPQANWVFTAPTLCGGKIQEDSATSFSITHTY